MQKIINDLKQHIARNFGKKCKEYNPFCANCIMWHAYETIKEGAKPLRKPKHKT